MPYLARVAHEGSFSDGITRTHRRPSFSSFSQNLGWLLAMKSYTAADRSSGVAPPVDATTRWSV